MGRGSVRFTRRAIEDARALGFDDRDMLDCVASLRRHDFYKSMPAELAAGLFQDVYHTSVNGVSIYLKLQIYSSGLLVIISFKQK